MDPNQNGDTAAPRQIKLSITFIPHPNGQGGEFKAEGIPDSEPMGVWLYKKLGQLMDGFYAQREKPAIVGAPAMHPAMREFLSRRH